MIRNNLLRYYKFSNISSILILLMQNNLPSTNQSQNSNQPSLFTSNSNQQQQLPAPIRPLQPPTASLFASNITQPQQNTNIHFIHPPVQQQQMPFAFNQQQQAPFIQQASYVQQPVVQQMPMNPFYQSNISNTNIGYFSPLSLFAHQGENIYSRKLNELSFADDELIPEGTAESKQKKLHVTLQSKIDFSLASQFQQIRLGSSMTLPCLCSLTGLGGTRASVDVICLIDQSGSMGGEKIQLVRDTMKYVLKMLTPKDRLSIAVYEDQGKRMCPFKFVNEDNQQSFKNIIDKLYAGGGNTMINGVELAIKMLRQRRTRNEVTSIFLLSDGQEPHDTDQRFKKMLELQENKDIGSFSLHSFGFGNDHDQNLMTKMCSIKDGNFYFINKLSTLDEAFCNALGGIITQTATDIQISLQCTPPPPVEAIAINKVYGDKWNKVSHNKYSISINQIMSEVTKDFVFELQIPPIAFKALDANRTLQVISASYTAVDTITKGKLEGKASLKLEFFDESAVLKRQSNPAVIEPYYRLLAVETMSSSIKLAEQGNYDQARKQIDDILETIKYHPSIRKDKVKSLLEDLQFAKQKCTKQVFQSEGRKQMVNLCYANTNNCSYQFSNNCQQQMLFDLKQAKKS